MKIDDDTKIIQWFEVSELAEKTRENYSIYMGLYCECIGKTPSDLLQEAVSEIKAGKLTSECSIVGYVARFKKSLHERNTAPTTQALALASVRSFYKFYDVLLPASVRKSKHVQPLKENQKMLTMQDVKRLLVNAKSLRDKAIILVMATSGMARMEVLNLRIGDIVIDEDGIGTINIRRQKTGVNYVTFISPEASKALEDYFEERKRIKKLEIRSCTDYVFVDYARGNPLDKIAFARIFEQLAEQLGYGNGNNQIICKSHNLRKFFASTLENASMPKNKIEYMLGHSRSGTDQAYFKVDINALKQLYTSFLPHITFEKTIEIRSINTVDEKRLAELEKTFEAMKQAFGLRQKEDGSFEFSAEVKMLPENHPAHKKGKVAVISTEELK